MLKSDGESKHYGAADGPRLGRQRANGVPNLARQYVEIEEGVPLDRRAGQAVGLKEVMPLQQNQNPLSKAPGAGAKRSGPKGGRPRVIEGEPWIAEGVSRRTWERRKKGGVDAGG